MVSWGGLMWESFSWIFLGVVGVVMKERSLFKKFYILFVYIWFNYLEIKYMYMVKENLKSRK